MFRQREGRVIPGGSTLFEKGTALWVRNYERWRKKRTVQETDRHELRYDVAVVGGGSAGLSAALVSFVATAYAELASKLPRAGGEIVYGYVAFNRTVSLVGGWLMIGTYVSSLAFYVTASGTLLSQLFPSLESIPLYTIAGSEVHLPMLLVGGALAVLVCVVNCYGTGLGANTQLVFFCAMLAIVYLVGP